MGRDWVPCFCFLEDMLGFVFIGIVFLLHNLYSQIKPTHKKRQSQSHWTLEIYIIFLNTLWETQLRFPEPFWIYFVCTHSAAVFIKEHSHITLWAN